MPVKNVYVSLDGGAEASRLEIEDFIVWSRAKLQSIDIFEVQVSEKNLGLVDHITSAIRRILEFYGYVVIVEDDIELSHKFYENMLTGLNLQKRSGRMGIVGGFSVLNLNKKLFFKNYFRPSRYIAIWGWACSSEVWKHYNPTLRSEMLLEELSGSKSWNSLTYFQKQVWLGRFRKTIDAPKRTWDIQLQYLSFVRDFVNLYPIMSFVRNEGFNDDRSTNTKNIKPFWMSSNSPSKKFIKNQTSGKLIELFFMFLDSTLLMGDSRMINYWKHRLKLRFPMYKRKSNH